MEIFVLSSKEILGEEYTFPVIQISEKIAGKRVHSTAVLKIYGK